MKITKSNIQDVTEFKDISIISGGGLCQCSDVHTWAGGRGGVTVSTTTSFRPIEYVTANEAECRDICCSKINWRFYSYNPKSDTELENNVHLCSTYIKDLSHEVCTIL